MANREKGRLTMLQKHVRFVLGGVIGLASVAVCLPAQAQIEFDTSYISIFTNGKTVPKAVFELKNMSAFLARLTRIDSTTGCKVKYPKALKAYEKDTITIACPPALAVGTKSFAFIVPQSSPGQESTVLLVNYVPSPKG